MSSASRRPADDLLRARLALRAAVTENVRAYFKGQDFLEVETPLVVPSPGLDLHLAAYAVTDAATGREFGYLITSPEYHMKRLLVAGVPRCVQLARCFRAGELGRRHQPEFTMLEWYRAHARLDDVLRDAEEIVRAAAAAGPVPGAVVRGGRAVPLAGPFQRLTVREAFREHAPHAGDPMELAERDEERYFTVLAGEVEPALGWDVPVFLTRFPARHASLARLADDDPTACERAELYVAGTELCNAFYELTDPAEQRRRFERDRAARAARGYPVFPVDEDFLAALGRGMPPSAGNALGLDRLIALVAGADDVADVMAFPHAPR